MAALVVTVHQIRIQDLTKQPTMTALCAGYELGAWRAESLVSDLFDRHLASFALSFTDWSSIDGDTAARSLRKAAKAVYETDKYRRRGEFGELLLHAAAKDFFGALPAVSKLHYKDSDNDTVKGFDCVHFVEVGGEIELWLGEVKFYKDLTKAIADSTAELQAHVDSNFLKREFVAITNKLDPSWPHSDAVRELLHSARSLDQILPRLVIPVMLTYDSTVVRSHKSLTQQYTDALSREVGGGWTRFAASLGSQLSVNLHLILVPLQDKERLLNLMHQKLQVWQHI